MVALPHQLQLLSTYLSHGLDGLLAAQPPIPANDLLNWFADPATQSTINTLKHLAQAAADLRQSRARFNAISTLDTLCTTSPDATERRLAATKILSPTRKDPTNTETNPPSRREGAAGRVRKTTETPQPGLPPQDSPAPQSSNAAPRTSPATLTHHAAAQAPQSIQQVPTTPGLPDINPEAQDLADDDLDEDFLDNESAQNLDDNIDEDADEDNEDFDEDAAEDAAEDAETDAHAARMEHHLGVSLIEPQVLKAISDFSLSYIAGTINHSTDDLPKATVKAAQRLEVHPRLLLTLEHIAAGIRARSP